MFIIKLVALYLLLYGILFSAGFGICLQLSRSEYRKYIPFLSPIAGILPLSIIPTYFSILGVSVSISGWISFICSCLFTLYQARENISSLKKDIARTSFLLVPILISIVPSFVMLSKAGYLSSTLQSYGAFVSIPADYLLKNAFNQTINVDWQRPISHLLAEVINNQEYFGPFFLLSAIASLLNLPPFKLYFVLSSVVGSLLPVSFYVAASEGFKLNSRAACFLSLLCSLNYSFFMWPAAGQLPMIAGLVFLVLAVGFIPAMFRDTEKIDCAFYAIFVAGVMSTYWILIPYFLATFVLYGVIAAGFSRKKNFGLQAAWKIGLGTLLVNPFVFVFLALHGAEILRTTSQFTQNIPRPAHLSELLGFGPHFGLSFHVNSDSYFVFLMTCFAAVLMAIGFFQRFKKKDFLFVSLSITMALFAFLFAINGFTYHFYKNSIVALYLLLSALIIGLDGIFLHTPHRLPRLLLFAICCLFVGLNAKTLIAFSVKGVPLISKELMDVEKWADIVPDDALTFIESKNPTEEAWLSYFLRKRKIKLAGRIEPWGFWILAPFSGKPQSGFFYDPERDHIDYTLSPKLLPGTDIVEYSYGKLLAENEAYLLSEGLPSPLLFKGWYPPERHNNIVQRWTQKRSQVIFDDPVDDYILSVDAIIPDVYSGPLKILYVVDGAIIGRFESSDTWFRKNYVIYKDILEDDQFVLTIELDRAFSPAEVYGSDDARTLGILVNSISLKGGEEFRIDGLLDMGLPYSDKFLIDGWAANETTGEGINYKWVNGKMASFVFFTDSPADTDMEFRAHPFTFEGCPRQHVDVLVNHQLVGSLAFDDSGWPTYRVRIPMDFIRKGLNIVEFSFAYSAMPSAVLKDNDDHRSLSAAFDYVKLTPVSKP